MNLKILAISAFFSLFVWGGCKFEEESLGEKCQYSYLREIYDEYYTKYAIDS